VIEKVRKARKRPPKGECDRWVRPPRKYAFVHQTVIGGYVTGRKGKKVERTVGNACNSRIRVEHELVEVIIGNQTRADRWTGEEQC
jgi:hypothetical protein